MIKLTRLMLGLALATGANLVFAASLPSPAVHATVAFMNALNPAAVLAAEAAAEGDADAVAKSLLDGLVAQGLISAAVGDDMLRAVSERLLRRDSFVRFLADLLNGGEVLAGPSPAEAESYLAVYRCGLHVPPGSPNEGVHNRVLSSADVSRVVRQFLRNADCFARRIADEYERPVE